MTHESEDRARRVEFLVNSLVVGGAERVVESLCSGLSSHGWSVGVACLRARGPIGEAIARSGLPVADGLAPRRRDPFQILGLRRHLARVGARVVYVLDHSNALLYGRLAAASLGLPQVCAVHRTGRADGSPSLSGVDRRLMGLSRRVIAVSETHARYLCEEEGLSESKIAVIPNGVDCERFGRQTKDPAAVGLPAGRRLLGVVAALRPEKNHEFLLRAVAGEDRLDGCDLVFAGEGPRRRELEALARALGLDGRVHWLGRVDDVAPVLAALDVLVLPSHPRVETFPLCVLEAMAASVPVVSTDVGSVSEMFGPEGAGALVPPGDVEALREALLQTIEDRAATATRVGMARRRVHELYSQSRMVAATASLLDEVIQA